MRDYIPTQPDSVNGVRAAAARVVISPLHRHFEAPLELAAANDAGPFTHADAAHRSEDAPGAPYHRAGAAEPVPQFPGADRRLPSGGDAASAEDPASPPGDDVRRAAAAAARRNGRPLVQGRPAALAAPRHPADRGLPRAGQTARPRH